LGIDNSGDAYYDTWINFTREALSCLDQERYNWLHLPSGKGYYEQDEFFIIVWEYIRYEYMLARADKVFMDSVKNRFSNKG